MNKCEAGRCVRVAVGLHALPAEARKMVRGTPLCAEHQPRGIVGGWFPYPIEWKMSKKPKSLEC